LEVCNISGLMAFYKKCYEMELIKAIPVLRFTSP